MALASLALALAFSGSSAARPTVSATSTSAAITTKGAANATKFKQPSPLLAQAQRISTDVPELGAWSIVANYPTTVESPSVASDGTFAYSVAGFAGGAPTAAVYKYDPVANTWTALANIPTALYDASIAYDANTNKIYVFGGYTGSVVLASTQIYDIASNTWTTGADMPDASGRYFSSAAYDSTNGKIYVLGGFDGATFSEQTNTWEYDPVANTWNTSRAPIPVAMGGPGYSIAGQVIYLAGHWNGGAGSTDHYKYDIVANAWTLVAPVPVAIYRPAAGVIATNEYLVGGGNPFLGASATRQARIAASLRAPATSYNTTYIYDTVGNAWTTGPNTNVPHSFTGGTAIGSSLVVVAGFNGSADTNTVEMATVGGISCTPCAGYVITTSGGNPIVPGTVDTGNHCDDCTTPITLPFAATLYGTTYTTVNALSNGSLEFIGSASPFGTSCPLPDGRIDRSIIPYQGDLRTDVGLSGCSNFASGCGIFTSVSGSAPNRIFNIEWRAVYFANNAVTANFEVRLYENTGCFDVVYGATADNGSAEESGVQSSPTGPATQFSCLAATLTTGLKTTYCPSNCPAPVPTDAVSRKMHGAAGTFDIELPRVDIHGAVGIEDRTQGAAGATCGAWVVRSPFGPPTAYGGSATSNGTYAYVAGGYSFDVGNDTNIFQRYDPVADAWTVLAPMPDAVTMASAVYSPVNNKVYVFGGENITGGTVSNATRIYDIPTNTWSAGANMPDIRAFMASGYNSANGKIYLIAGYSTGNVTPAGTQVWEYDPIANTFNTSRMPYPNANGIGGPGFGIINGHFYVAGGRDGTNTEIALVYDYNIGADTWTARASLPAPNNVPGSGVVNGQLAVFGGGNPFALAPETTGATVIYDPGSDTWSNGPTLNQIRSFPAGTAIGSTLVAAGGYTGVSTTGSTETTSCGAGFGHQMVVTFATPVTVASASVTTGAGSVSSFSVSSNVVTVNLSGVANAQRLQVTLGNVCDGTNQGNVLIPMGVLSGDTNGNGAVSSADVALTKAQVGAGVGGSNFREDVNANGTISSADVSLVKAKTGTALPP